MTILRLSAATCGLALALIVVPAPLSARQGSRDSTVRGGAILVQVTDTSINPIAAEVVLPALALGVRLSEEGTLLLVNVPDGIYLIQARHIGHVPDWRLVRVARDTARAEFVLAPTESGASRGGLRSKGDGGVAQSRLIAFLARTTAIPSGSFLTRKEIERRRARTMTALLARVHDVKIDRAKSGAVTIRSADATDAAGAACPSGMLVFVDAVPLDEPGTLAAAEPEEQSDRRPRRRAEWRVAGGTTEPAQGALRWLAAVGRGLVTAPPAPAMPAAAPRPRAEIDRLPMASVTAVEVYPTHPGVPPEFRVPGAECGVVLVWTGG
jgi:hypothetical protein